MQLEERETERKGMGMVSSAGCVGYRVTQLPRGRQTCRHVRREAIAREPISARVARMDRSKGQNGTSDSHVSVKVSRIGRLLECLVKSWCNQSRSVLCLDTKVLSKDLVGVKTSSVSPFHDIDTLSSLGRPKTSILHAQDSRLL